MSICLGRDYADDYDIQQELVKNIQKSAAEKGNLRVHQVFLFLKKVRWKKMSWVIKFDVQFYKFF